MFFFEKFFGQNIIGNVSPDGTRVVSFFKDELVVGAFFILFWLFNYHVFSRA